MLTIIIGTVLGYGVTWLVLSWLWRGPRSRPRLAKPQRLVQGRGVRRVR